MTYRTDYPDYSAAHHRVRSERGRAIEHRCVDCGGPAEEWSYDHADDQELTYTRGGRTITYSANPDHYDPRCRTCHWRFDRPPTTVVDGSQVSGKCGTYAGWNEHKRGKTQPCRPCRLAYNEYQRNYRARA